MLAHRVAVAVAVAVALVLAACSPRGEAIRLDASADGTQMSLSVGDRLEVALAGNPTTGYSWEIASVDESVILADGEPSFRADSNQVGAGGTMTLAFDAVGAGTTVLELVYQRPFEDAPPAETFTVTLVVSE